MIKPKLGRSASVTERPILSEKTRAGILVSQSKNLSDVNSVVTKEQKMVEQYPSAYAATNTVPSPIRVDTGYVFKWDHLETFSAEILKQFIKHPANCRASNDINARNLSDITCDIATNQRDVCYAIKINDEYFVVEGWRRTQGAILEGAPLTLAICDLSNTSTIPTYIDVYSLVLKLSTKEQHSMRDRGIHYLEFIEKNKVSNNKCAEAHFVTLATLNRDLAAAKPRSDWLAIFESFKDFKRNDYAKLNRIEKSIKNSVDNNPQKFLSYIENCVIESLICIDAVNNDLREPLEISKMLDLIVCPLNKSKPSKKENIDSSIFVNFNDDRKVILIEKGLDFSLSLSNFSIEQTTEIKALVKTYLENIN